MSVFDILGSARRVAILGNQFGDEGKVKFVDIFAEWADVIVRGTGGANAGHTIQLPNKRYALHLIPSGILHDGRGKINVIGSGVAFDPVVACRELRELREAGISSNNLRIAENAKLVLPQHLVMDRIGDGLGSTKRIGTTGRGIGPTYVDHYDRTGLIVSDLLNPGLLRWKLERNLAKKALLLSHFGVDSIQAVMDTLMDNGEPLRQFYCPRRGDIFDSAAIVDYYLTLGQQLIGYIADTTSLVRQAVADGEHILLEGSQAVMLSVDNGTYPFVTSTDCSVHGLAVGAGMRERDIDLTLAVTKAFYMSRVGGGPFPTEMGGAESARWCSQSHVTRRFEDEELTAVSINDSDDFRQGVAVRRTGAEYGTTTGRPRRVGWLDLPLLRSACQIHGVHVILSKVDVLNDCERIKICVAYRYEGPRLVLGESVLAAGAEVLTAQPRDEILSYCRPVYQEFPGWQRDLTDCHSYAELPSQLRDCVHFVEQATGVKVRAISTGPERSQVITK